MLSEILSRSALIVTDEIMIEKIDHNGLLCSQEIGSFLVTEYPVEAPPINYHD